MSRQDNEYGCETKLPVAGMVVFYLPVVDFVSARVFRYQEMAKGNGARLDTAIAKLMTGVEGIYLT